MTKIIEFLSGKKTFLVALGIAVVAGCKAFGVEIPVWIWPLLAAIGLGAVRAGIKKTEP